MENFFKTANLILASFLSPLLYLLNNFVISDLHFILNLVVIIICDTILGIIVGYKKGEISSSKFGKLFIKIAVYFMVLSASHNASTYTVNGTSSSLLSWLDAVVYAMIIAREMLSIFEKTTILGIFAPPAWIIKRLDIIANPPDTKENTESKEKNNNK